MDFKGIFFNIKDYKINKRRRLGKGSFGIVYIAENIKTHEQFAIKIIDVDNDFDGDDQMLIMRECSILSKLKHCSIVKYYGISFRSFEDPSILQPGIITEYVSKGSLKSILDNEKIANAEFDWTSTKKYINLLGISNAMKYLHKNGILHLDLKPENILIDDNFYPKVCDFGLSRCFPLSLSKSIKLATKGQIGTPLYMAPELLDEKDEYEYTTGVDVYAFAMIAYEICTGEYPFHELKLSNCELKKKILGGYRPKFNKFVSTKMQNLLQRCWNQSIQERPSFNEIFHELSSDFSYSSEILDENEINEYLDDILNENENNLNNNKKFIDIKDSIAANQKVINDLKIKNDQLSNEIIDLKNEIKTKDEKNQQLFLNFQKELQSIKEEFKRKQNEHESNNMLNDLTFRIKKLESLDIENNIKKLKENVQKKITGDKIINKEELNKIHQEIKDLKNSIIENCKKFDKSSDSVEKLVTSVVIPDELYDDIQNAKDAANKANAKCDKLKDENEKLKNDLKCLEYEVKKSKELPVAQKTAPVFIPNDILDRLSRAENNQRRITDEFDKINDKCTKYVDKSCNDLKIEIENIIKRKMKKFENETNGKNQQMLEDFQLLKQNFIDTYSKQNESINSQSTQIKAIRQIVETSSLPKFENMVNIRLKEIESKLGIVNLNVPT